MRTPFKTLLKSKWPEYLMEIAVIAIGISLSFLLNEWREDRMSRKIEIESLCSIRADMLADSTHLVEGIEFFSRSDTLNKYLTSRINAPVTHADSLKIALVNFGSYVAFDPQNVGYQQLKETGQPGIIRDKKLLKALIELYSSGYKNLLEINSIDKKYTLDLIVPEFVSIVTREKKYIFSGTEKEKQTAGRRILQKEEFQKALFLNRQLKMMGKTAYEEVLQKLRRLIPQVEEVLQQLGADCASN